MANSFKNHFLRLLSGTLIAHLISALSLVIISRLYEKEDFDQLAIFMSISGILGAIASARMDLSVLSSGDHLEKLNSVILGILFIVIMLVISSIVVLLFSSEFAIFFNISDIVLRLLPLSAGLFAFYTLLANYNVAVEETKTVAVTKVMRTISQSFGQICLFFHSLGLVFGELIGRIVGVWPLLQCYLRDVTNSNFHLRSIKWYQEIANRKKFITFSTFGTLLNTLVLYSPQLSTAALFSAGSAGALLIGQRLVAIPMVFIGQSMSQAYSIEFKKCIHIDSNTALKLFLTLSKRLFLVSVLVFGIGAYVAPFIIPYLLGERWKEVGTFISLLCPMFACQLTATPVINTGNILGKQKQLFIWDFCRLLFVIVLLYFTNVFELTINNFIFSFSIGMSLMYVVIYFYLLNLLYNQRNVHE